MTPQVETQSSSPSEEEQHGKDEEAMRERALMNYTKTQAQLLQEEDEDCVPTSTRKESNVRGNPRSYSTGKIVPASISREMVSTQKWFSERNVGGSKDTNKLDDQNMASSFSPRKLIRSDSFDVEQIVPKRSPSGVGEFPSYTSLEQDCSGGSKKMNISNNDRSVLQQLSCLDRFDGNGELSEGDTFNNENTLPEHDTITTSSSEPHNSFAASSDVKRHSRTISSPEMPRDQSVSKLVVRTISTDSKPSVPKRQDSDINLPAHNNGVPSQVMCMPSDSRPTKPLRQSSRRQLITRERSLSLLSLTSLYSSIPSNN
jgi:hypothetical protein